jgi:hypothetical protein
MAAPQLGIQVFRDNTHGTTYLATKLRQELSEGTVIFQFPWYIRVSDNRQFKINCLQCHYNNCDVKLTNKLGEWGGAGTQNYQPFFKHKSVNPERHHDLCPCHENYISGSKMTVKRRFLEHRIFIQTRNDGTNNPHPLIIEYFLPNINAKPEDIIERFNTNLRPKLSNFEPLEETLPPNVCITGILNESNNPRVNYSYTDEEIYSTSPLNLSDLDYRCWSRNLDNELEPLKVKVNHDRQIVNLRRPSYSGGFFMASENSQDNRRVRAPIFGGYLKPYQDDFDAMVQDFESVCRERGYSLHIEDPEVQVSFFPVGESESFVMLENRSESSKSILFAVYEIGSTDEIESDAEGELIEFVGAREPNQFANLVLDPNTTSMHRISITGDARFEVSVNGNTMFSKIIHTSKMASKNQAPQIRLTNEPISRSEFEEIVKKTYPEFILIPSNNATLQLSLADWVDFDRFMFTRSLNQGQDDVALQGVTLRNSKLLKLLTSFDANFNTNAYDESTTKARFAKMFESQYSPIIVDETTDEFDELVFHVKHNLIKINEYGWFGPKNSDYVWLIDHRSWAQLKQDNPQLSEHDISFLPSGHRLIRRESTIHYDKQQISEIAYFSQFSMTPEEVLVNAFDVSKTSIEDQERGFSNVRESILNGAKEYVHIEPKEMMELRFQVWNSRDFERERLRNGIWSLTSEPHIVEIENYHITLHRVINEFYDDLFQHTLYLVLRQENHAPRMVTFYKSKNLVRPNTVSENDWRIMTKQMKWECTWRELKTHLRAYAILAHQNKNIGDYKKWEPLLDYHVRHFLKPTIFEDENEQVSPIESIKSIDEHLANHIQQYILKKMWII